MHTYARLGVLPSGSKPNDFEATQVSTFCGFHSKAASPLSTNPSRCRVTWTDGSYRASECVTLTTATVAIAVIAYPMHGLPSIGPQAPKATGSWSVNDRLATRDKLRLF